MLKIQKIKEGTKMKQIRIILLLMLVLSLVLGTFTSCDVINGILGNDSNDDDNEVVCEHAYENGKCLFCGAEEPKDDNGNENGGNENQPNAEELAKEEWLSKYETITIAEALTMCENHVDKPSTERYYIIAKVKSVDSESYGQLTIEDETGEIMVYGTNSADGSLKYDKMGISLKAGDLILIYGTLQNYKGTTKEVQNAWLIDCVEGEVVPPSIEPGSTITVAEALALAGSTGANDRYYITGTVVSVTNAAYGAMIIADETGEISIYNSKNADGTVDYANMEDKPYKGDTVTVYATLQNFNGSKEIKSAYITAFEHAPAPDESDYTAMTVAEAREAADGALAKVSGVVARITFANGYKPSGFYLIDGTNSIYVYDGDAAARVSEGNTVTVLAEKAHWILDSEQSNAKKYGYKGCNQLTNAYLLSNDESNTAFDTSWITESTMKSIIDTPVSTDISTTIYKVNALVKKVVPESGGFVNYYFFDLDGTTGSYAYTQCNGGDFAWLDEFDGKICTVYISALNAKSTASACYWRFIPVAVSYDNYQFDLANTPDFVLDYHVMGQFFSKYTSDPALEVITSVSSELLGFEGAAITYTTDNETVGKFTTENGKTVFNLIEYGTVTVTATATYGSYTESNSLTITFEEPPQYNAIDVETAIGSELGSTIIVQGIVGPSLVNQSGFYLIDETGFIAVTLSADELENFEMGQMVIIQGTRDRKVKTDDAGNPYDCHGQTQIKDAILLLNLYGEHEYNLASHATTLTVEEFYAFDKTEDHTTELYVIEAYVFVEQYSIKLGNADGSIKFNLYASGVGQYYWLKEYGGQKLTIYVAPCNWNSKGYYAGCAMAAVLSDGTIVYNTLNFDN
jgi:DNA/RNA endonuclease YhcR with UshA esterase domain